MPLFRAYTMKSNRAHIIGGGNCLKSGEDKFMENPKFKDPTSTTYDSHEPPVAMTTLTLCTLSLVIVPITKLGNLQNNIKHMTDNYIAN